MRLVSLIAEVTIKAAPLMSAVFEQNCGATDKLYGESFAEGLVTLRYEATMPSCITFRHVSQILRSKPDSSRQSRKKSSILRTFSGGEMNSDPAKLRMFRSLSTVRWLLRSCSGEPVFLRSDVGVMSGMTVATGNYLELVSVNSLRSPICRQKGRET